MTETKRRRLDPELEDSDTTTTPPPAVAEMDPGKWNGFCEIESEPVLCHN